MKEESAPSCALLLLVLSVFAVFALLDLEAQLPGGRDGLEPILEPNQVLPVAPVRRHEHAPAVQICLWYLPSYLVRVHVPVLLPANLQLVQPVPLNFA